MVSKGAPETPQQGQLLEEHVFILANLKEKFQLGEALCDRYCLPKGSWQTAVPPHVPDFSQLKFLRKRHSILRRPDKPEYFKFTQKAMPDLLTDR